MKTIQEPDWENAVIPHGLQELSPWAARLCLAVERFARQLLKDAPQKGPLLIALSGGPDSMALIMLMNLLAGRLGFTLAAAHLDHGLRPESIEDVRFCKNFCRRLDIPFHLAAVDVGKLAHETHTGIEDAGRKARYAWFTQVSEEISACAVATGHQLDDLAADQLMRLMRGAGWPALGGMPAWDPSRRLVRPLLMTPKADLIRFLQELRIPWREDASNAQKRFTRNRVRLDILPLFLKENPGYLETCAELWRQAAMDREHWEQCAVEAETAAPDPADPGFLPNAMLHASSAALRLRLYKRAVEALGPGQPLSGALRRLDQAWQTRAVGKRLQFPGGKTAEVTHGGIQFHGVDTLEG